GLNIVKSAAVDLVLLDMRMPVLDGPETIKAIRRAGMRLPIIGMSGFLFGDIGSPGEDVLAKAIALGADAALRKPFKPIELLRAIETCLAQTTTTIRPFATARSRDARPAARG